MAPLMASSLLSFALARKNLGSGDYAAPDVGQTEDGANEADRRQWQRVSLSL